MARLILEEAGARRAFRVKQGRLTIGSGEGASLRLASPGVAEVHAELAFEGDHVTLEPRPGVLPPEVDGEPISVPTAIPHGATFTIGEARFHLEYADPAKAPAAAPARPAPARAAAPRAGAAAGGAPQRAPAARPGAARKPAGSQAAGAGGGAARPRVQHSRRKIERGMPTWLVIGIIGVVAIVAVFVVKNMLGGMGEGRLDPRAALAQARLHFDEGLYEYAGTHLDRIERTNPDLSEGLRAQIRDLRAKIRAKKNEAELFTYNSKGTEWKQTQLERFVSERLQGEPQPERVRVFLMRCREFRERWPQHPEMDWVDRYEARFEPFYDLSQEPSFDDLAFEVKTLTWAMPRDYERAFAILEGFRETASPEDRAKVDELLATLRTEEQEYFVDRMQQARYHWEKDEKDLSVGWLVELVIGLEDEDLIDQAATELANLPGVDPNFAGYEEHEPEKWKELMEHPTIAAMPRS